MPEFLELDTKRTEAVEFTANNVRDNDRGRNKLETRVDGNDVHFENRLGEHIMVRVLSKQADFACDLNLSELTFDNDTPRLRAYRAEMIDTIASLNDRGITPGFLPVAPEVDTAQLVDRTKHLVNHGHFLKQELPSEYNPKPHWDQKKLDPLELVLMQLYAHTEMLKGKSIMGTMTSGDEQLGRSRHGPYFPELNYYDPKNERIVSYFLTKNRRVKFYKDAPCPTCSRPNEPYDHRRCKTTGGNIDWVNKRNQARYNKRIITNLERHAIDSKRDRMSERGVSYVGSDIPLTDRSIRIALIDR